MMVRFWRSLTVGLLIFLVITQSFGEHAIAAELLAEQLLSEQLLSEQCQTIQVSELRPGLTDAVQSVFGDRLTVDFESLVAKQWDLLNLDTTFDHAVVQAIQAIKPTTSTIDKFQGSWRSGEATKLATLIITETMADAGLQRQLQRLSENVSQTVAAQVETATLDAASQAIDCLQQFVSQQYATTFFDAFNHQAQTALQQVNQTTPQTLSLKPEGLIDRHFDAGVGLAMLGTSRALVKGVGKTLEKRVGQQLIDRLTQQLVKRVLGKGTAIIPIVGEILGAVLIADDVITSLAGPFDLIQAELQQPEVKQTVQLELVALFNQEVTARTAQIGPEIANQLYSLWLDFQKNYAAALQLANEVPQMKALLAQPNLNLERLTILVSLALEHMGRQQLIGAIADGSFTQALSFSPDADRLIAQTGSIQQALDWQKITGANLAEVVRLALPQVLSIASIDRPFLENLLALQNDQAIQQLVKLPIATIKTLLSISPANLVKLAQSVSIDQLARLSTYITNLAQPEADALAQFLNGHPGEIRNETVITHIVQSRNIQTAIAFLTEPMKLRAIPQELGAVILGQLYWGLLGDKYGQISTIVAAVFGLIALLLLLRIGFWIYGKMLDIRQKQLTIALLAQQKQQSEKELEKPDAN